MKRRPFDSAVSFHVTRWSDRLRSGGYCLIACSFFRPMQASRLDPPYQFEWTEFIADLQNLAVTEWLQSFNSVRGPMERL